MSAEKKEEVSQPTNLVRLAPAAPSIWISPEWTPERIALAKKAVTPASATHEDFEFFIAWCKRTGLDPFIKQAYLVERWDRASNQTRHEPLAAEAGMAARADAQPDYGGMRSGVVYAGDEFMIDEAAQSITHRWSVEARAKAGNKVVGAWAHAKRAGREIEISYVTFESRAARKKDQTLTKFWATDPAGQLRKCARADQYRRAYPNIFAGVYVDAERDPEEREVNEAPQPTGDAAAKTKALAQRLGVKPLDTPQAVTASAQTVDAPPKSPPRAESVGAAAKGAAESAPLPASSDVISFGAHKGKKIVEATTAALLDAQSAGQAEVKKAPSAKWAPGVLAVLAAISVELEQREAALAREMDGPPSEPGSEG